MRQQNDVVIVGAGPAGTTLAYELSRRGVSTLIVDKEKFPRPKPCGGGLTVEAYNLLNADLREVLQNSVSSLEFAFNGTAVFRRSYEKPIMYTVEREQLDQLLLDRAVSAGARVADGQAVHGITLANDHVEVTTGQGVHFARFVAGADGFRSVVARSLGRTCRTAFVGIESEVTVQSSQLDKWHTLALADLGIVPHGYGWVFPKRDHLSIGIGAAMGKAANLKSSYWRFLSSLKLEKYEVTRWSAALIPTCAGRSRVTEGRAVLIGDAAGLADPLTGEGIGNAILSAHLAAPALCKALETGPGELQQYQANVDELISPENKAAMFFRRVIYTVPRKLLAVAAADARIWEAGCQLVRGETTYTAIKGKVGTVGGLYSILRGKFKQSTGLIASESPLP